MGNILAKGTIFLMISQIVTVLSGYVIHIGTAHFLGPSFYGVFGVLLSLVFIFRSIFLAGVNRAVSKYISQKKEWSSMIVNAGYRLVFILALLAMFSFLLMSFFSAIFEDQTLKKVIFLTSFCFIPIGFYSVASRGYLNGLRLFKQQAISEIIHSSSRAIIAVGALLLSFGLMGVISGYVVAPIIALAVSLYFVKKHKETTEKSNVENRSSNSSFGISQIFSFGFAFTLFNGLTIITMDLGLLMLKLLLRDNILAGYYTAAATIGKITFFLLVALPLTMLPSVSSSVAQAKNKLTRKYINYSIRYALLILLPITILISIFSKQIITLLYPSEFIIAASALQLLVFASTLFGLFLTLNSFIQAIHKPWHSFFISLFIGMIALILTLTLIPKYGLFGAALATTISALSGVIIAGFYVKRKFNTLFPLNSFMKIGAGSFMMYLVGTFIESTNIHFVISAILLVLLYLLTLVLFKELSKKDYDLFLAMLPWLKKG